MIQTFENFVPCVQRSRQRPARTPRIELYFVLAGVQFSKEDGCLH
jgi:hypothetical protein